MAKAFTLLELIVTIIIIGILGAVAFPSYTRLIEGQYDKDATVNLKLIMAAEKIYRMEAGGYFGEPSTSDLDAINSNLRLSLPKLDKPKWGYKIVVSGSDDTCYAQATRSIVSGRKWSLSNTANEPNCSGSCL